MMTSNRYKLCYPSGTAGGQPGKVTGDVTGSDGPLLITACNLLG